VADALTVVVLTAVNSHVPKSLRAPCPRRAG
jgi:hypothetical protein